MALQAMVSAAIASTYSANLPSSSALSVPPIPNNHYATLPLPQTSSFIEEITSNDTTSSYSIFHRSNPS